MWSRMQATSMQDSKVYQAIAKLVDQHYDDGDLEVQLLSGTKDAADQDHADLTQHQSSIAAWEWRPREDDTFDPDVAIKGKDEDSEDELDIKTYPRKGDVL